MTLHVVVQGADELKAVAARLAAAGEIEMKKAMVARMRTALLPLPPIIRASAMAYLPKAGGANRWVADAKVSPRITATPRTGAVSIRMWKTGHDLRSIDRGYLRHPTFGNTDHWFTTRVPPGFFTKPCLSMAPAVNVALRVAMADTAAFAGFTHEGLL